MNLKNLFVGLLIVTAFAIPGRGQSKERPLGSIRLVKCIGCDERIAPPTDIEYPGLVGYGPHKYQGEVAVQIRKAALNAKFTPLILGGRPVKVASSIRFNFRR